MKHLKISPLLIPAVVLAWLCGSLHTFLITYISLLLHEGVHLFCIFRKKILIRKITLEPFGICMQTEQQLPESLGVYLFAPLWNLALAGGIWLWHQKIPLPYGGDWFFANLLLGIFNLMPCLPMDGGRALQLYLSRKKGTDFAQKQLQMLSLSLASFLIAAGLWLMWYTKYNISLIVIGIFLLYTALSHNPQTHENNILNRFNRSDPENTLPVCYLAADRNCPARKVIQKFRGDRYYIVNVLQNGTIIKTVTETGILKKLLSCDGEIFLYEC